MKTCFSILLFLLSFTSLHAQVYKDVSDEVKFYDHLLSRGLVKDAAFQYKRIVSQELSVQQSDSLNYLTGWNLYERKLLDSSSVFLLRVSPSSSSYLKSQMFAAYNLSYVGKTDSALYILNNLSVDSLTQKIVKLQKAGIAILEGDHLRFAEESKSFDSSYFVTSLEEQNMKKYDSQLSRIKNKSPVIAAGLSALLPGAGKFYAGKRAEGIISFFQIAALGFVAWENYNKAGAENGRFITAASVLGIFYIGNIWGSYFSVSIKKNEKRNEIKNAVLFNMHVPLRNAYR